MRGWLRTPALLGLGSAGVSVLVAGGEGGPSGSRAAAWYVAATFAWANVAAVVFLLPCRTACWPF